MIAYYDTDSILVRFDVTNPEANQRVQELFDKYQEMCTYSDKGSDMWRIYRAMIKENVIQEIGNTIDQTKEMATLNEI